MLKLFDDLSDKFLELGFQLVNLNKDLTSYVLFPLATNENEFSVPPCQNL